MLANAFINVINVIFIHQAEVPVTLGHFFVLGKLECCVRKTSMIPSYVTHLCEKETTQGFSQLVTYSLKCFHLPRMVL